ncbi:hypothetical protein AC1031_010257 [Aphanomyces cochlioides]|nr:hypothetical protein AC1031_010257 [Aphanomyces cochlioides]
MTAPSVSDVHEDEANQTTRSKFACCDDIILRTQIAYVCPWEASRKKIMSAWDEIAAGCAKTSGFGLRGKKGPALKTRFKLLLDSFNTNEMASLRKSGVPEQYEEREMMLGDIEQRMDDFNEVKQVQVEADKKKQEGIENSGLILRRMAMGELASVGEKKKLKVSPSKADAVSKLVAVVKESVEAKMQREEEVAAANKAMLEFLKDQAMENAQRFQENQQVLLALLTNILC